MSIGNVSCLQYASQMQPLDVFSNTFTSVFDNMSVFDNKHYVSIIFAELHCCFFDD